MTDINRRDFVRATALAGVAAGAPDERVRAQAPGVRTGSVRPVVIASGNGNRLKNGGERTCVEEAFRLLGFGGLPNADGIVRLDSCCMHGPKKRAGGVAALEGVRTPSHSGVAAQSSPT